MYIEDLNLIFIHIPKNGGTSITSYFQKNFKTIGQGHLRGFVELRRYSKQNPSLVAVVRDPISRSVSNYNYSLMSKSYHHSSDGSTKYGEHPDLKILKNKSFSEYLSLVEKNKLRGLGVSKQHYWVDKVDDISFLSFENLSLDFSHFMSEKYGISNVLLPSINISSKNNFNLTEDEKNRIKSIYREDFDLIKKINNGSFA